MVDVVKVRELAAARSGDKGSVLDLTLTAFDDAGYETLARLLSASEVGRWLAPVADGPVRRYELPALRSLKYVLPQALAGGLYASLHAGLHWQKAVIWVLLDHDLPEGAG